MPIPLKSGEPTVPLTFDCPKELADFLIEVAALKKKTAPELFAELIETPLWDQLNEIHMLEIAERN